jgi:ubiquinone/menaquinone biosynthesis C-methylase UbiE
MGLKELIRKVFRREKFKASSEAYDLWSGNYDRQPGNLMLDLDEKLFEELGLGLTLKNAVIVDIGCGTGRHWPAILAQEPASLTGFDSSPGMIARLKEKFPHSKAFVSSDQYLAEIRNESVDLIISTLTIAHIQDLRNYFDEWVRVLKPGGRILLTDYHPAALERGAKRTFKHQDKTIAIRNYVHSLSSIRQLAGQRNLTEERFLEKFIDEKVKHYYEAQDAIQLYEAFRSQPIIFGMLLKKSDASS